MSGSFGRGGESVDPPPFFNRPSILPLQPRPSKVAFPFPLSPVVRTHAAASKIWRQFSPPPPPFFETISSAHAVWDGGGREKNLYKCFNIELGKMEGEESGGGTPCCAAYCLMKWSKSTKRRLTSHKGYKNGINILLFKIRYHQSLKAFWLTEAVSDFFSRLHLKYILVQNSELRNQNHIILPHRKVFSRRIAGGKGGKLEQWLNNISTEFACRGRAAI